MGDSRNSIRIEYVHTYLCKCIFFNGISELILDTYVHFQKSLLEFRDLYSLPVTCHISHVQIWLEASHSNELRISKWHFWVPREMLDAKDIKICNAYFLSSRVCPAAKEVCRSAILRIYVIIFNMIFRYVTYIIF